MALELEIVRDAEELARRGAERMAAVIADAAAAGGTVSVALAGGTTPRAVHAALAATEGVPFEAVEVWFGDERCVPPDDTESNYRMARETLLDPVGVERFAAVHRIRGEEANADAEAERYGALLPDALDLVVLGVGEDGHTASLFPGDPATGEVRRKAVAVLGPKPPPNRITLTPRAIVAARCVLVLAAGGGKAEAVERALEAPPDPHAVPAQLGRSADPGKPRYWIVDRAAAGRLHPDWHRSAPA